MQHSSYFLSILVYFRFSWPLSPSLFLSRQFIMKISTSPSFLFNLFIIPLSSSTDKFTVDPSIYSLLFRLFYVYISSMCDPSSCSLLFLSSLLVTTPLLLFRSSLPHEWSTSIGHCSDTADCQVSPFPPPSLPPSSPIISSQFRRFSAALVPQLTKLDTLPILDKIRGVEIRINNFSTVTSCYRTPQLIILHYSMPQLNNSTFFIIQCNSLRSNSTSFLW